jgi:hypothetical protein
MLGNITSILLRKETKMGMVCTKIQKALYFCQTLETFDDSVIQKDYPLLASNSDFEEIQSPEEETMR